MYSKVIACLLCLAVSAGAVRAQEGRPERSDLLKKKIDSVSLVYKRMLRRQYRELIASLEADIKDVKELKEKADTPEAKDGFDDRIRQLDKELADAIEKANSLDAETQETAAEELAAAQTGRSTNSEQLPSDCPAGADAKKNLPPGLIWCAPADHASLHDVRMGKPTLSAQKFAEYAAPILWFSPNEPLRIEGNHIPEPLPGDLAEDNIRAVVYYRISEVLLQPRVLKSELAGTDQLELEKIKALTLKYYFYYSKDVGFGEHLHDLESVRYDVNFTLRREDGGEVKDDYRGRKYYVAHISRVIGAAHGVTWYGNQLDIGGGERHTSLPITLLIEEGKHATTPDRNADGFYSPGYDVNRRYTDAWGVRDLLGSGALGSPGYEGAMTKPRRPSDMVRVDPVAADPARLFEFYVGDHRDKLATARRYRLRPARVFETRRERREWLAREAERIFKEEDDRQKWIAKKDEEDEKIVNWMKEEKFGEVKGGEFVTEGGKPKPGEVKKTHGDSSLLRAARWGHGIERNEEFFDAIPIALRAEGRQYGFTILPPVIRYRVPKVGGYLLPKMNFMFPNTREGAIPGRKMDRQFRFSLEALYTPSAARTFDWYVATGVEWERPDPSLSFAVKPVSEGGLRWRFNGGAIGLPLLIGGRIGLRATGFPEARQPRLIFELGTGAF